MRKTAKVKPEPSGSYPKQGWSLDYKASRIPKVLMGLCIGQTVILIAVVATLGAVVRENIYDIDNLKTQARMTESYMDGVKTEIDKLQADVTDMQEYAMANSVELCKELESNVSSQYRMILYLNETLTDRIVVSNLSKIETDIPLLSQLTTDMNYTKTIIQDYDARINTLNSDRSIDRALLIDLSTEMANIRTNLTIDISDQNDFLTVVNETVTNLVLAVTQMNTSSRTEMERLLAELEAYMENRLSQVETDIQTNRARINDTTIDVETLHKLVTLENEKYQNLILNLTALEKDTAKIKAAVENNTAGIVNMKDQFRLLNLGGIHYLSSNVSYLEAELATVEAATQDNTNGIATTAAWIQKLDMETSKLETMLTDVTDALNCTWNNWTSFSTCTVSCGGGIEYRTRSCVKNNPLSPDWLPKTETAIQQCNTQACSDARSAFTVIDAADGPGGSDSKITFETFITDIGGHFDKRTGRYTCQYSGIYLFSLNLQKHESEPKTFCYIYVNGVLKAGTNCNPQTVGGWISSSNTIVLHLQSGDAVTLGLCTSAKTLAPGSTTSFTGVLLIAD